MGGWFANYFCKRRYEIKIFDKNPSAASRLARKIGATMGRSIKDVVHDADVTLVAVPPDVTASVVGEALGYAKQGGVVIEVSSLKAHVVTSLKRLKHTRVRLLSVHPLFGPGASSMKGRVVALIPIKSRSSELRIAKSLFGDAKIVAVDWRTHDKVMAYALSLSHALAISLVFATDSEMLNKLKRLSGTTFRLQMLSAATSLSESPEFMASAFKMNPYAFRVLLSYKRKLNELLRIISKGDVRKLERIFKECRAKVGPRLYGEAYEFLEGSSRSR